MKSRLSTIDVSILWTAAIIGAFGVIMVYDASAVSAALRHRFSNSHFFLERQILWFIVGLITMVIASRISMNRLQPYILPLTLATLILMFMVVLPGIGHSVGGAKRWLKLGFFSVQPGELMRLILAIYLAHLFSVKKEQISDFKDTFLPAFTVTGIAILLLVAQPKFGTALILALLTGAMLFVAGVPFYQMILAFLSSLPLLLFAILRVSYVQQRINAWLYPAEYMRGVGFQTMQSLIAIGSGSLTGVGLGQGRQKMFYLPEAHTDMIFPVIAEELGLIGIAIVLGGFFYILVRGYHIARSTTECFGKLLAVSLTISILTPALLNIMVATGLFPVTGIALPLVSYGGTALVTDMTLLGLLAGIPHWTTPASGGLMPC